MSDCIIKRVVSKVINKTLKENADDVTKVKETLTVWSGRIRSVCAVIDCLLDKIADNEITPDEIKQAGEEIQELVKTW